jgi:hypothetical protein
MISMINDPNTSDEKRTGAIYLVERQITKNIISNWNHLFQIMKCICETHFVTKQTIQDRIMELYETLFNSAYQLSFHGKEEIEKYKEFILYLISFEENNPNLHWKYKSIIASFLILFIRLDENVKYPLEGVKWFLKNMNSDIEKIRSLSFDIIPFLSS